MLGPPRSPFVTVALAATLSVGLGACQTVLESGDEASLDPLAGAASASSTSSTTTSTTLPPTTLAPTTLPPTTLPPTTLAPTTLPPTTLPPTTLPPTTLPPTTLPPTTLPPTTLGPTTLPPTTTTAPSTTTTGPPAASTTTTTEPFYSDEPATGVLREGDRGERTRAVQDTLVRLGYLPSGSADGLFGPVTTEAVKEFQDDNDLEVDGLVGPNTQAALAAADA